MPLTSFQREVLSHLVANRSEASHFAGGLVLNAADDSARFSNDFDLFHDIVADVAAHSESDVAILEGAGYRVEKEISSGAWDHPTSFRTAAVSKGEQSVDIDWAQDSAFRFFPIVPDPLLGWRLHLFDMATNKALALSARTETRDYIDIVELGRIYPLEAIIWAACGKDEGFTPQALLAMVRRFAKISPGTVEKIKARDLDPIAMKMQWIEMSDCAEQEITRIADTMPDLPIGVAFVNEKGEPGWIGNDAGLKIHAGSIRGCWPAIHDPPSP